MATSLTAEYVWVGGRGELRSKARVFHAGGTLAADLSKFTTADAFPVWNYDGSSTEQAPGSDSEILLHPAAVYPCPFRKGNNVLVMCECKTPAGKSAGKNNRSFAKALFDQKLDEAPWFGIEQEFFLMDVKTGMPTGWPSDGLPEPQFQYYCSVGGANAFGRACVDETLANLIAAGLEVSGINAEVAPGQWEYQIGPAEGINSGDQLWISRYILERTAEKYGFKIDYEPKPIQGDWNGSGCHTNYSTAPMRADGGLEVIKAAMDSLAAKHDRHMAHYGANNRARMTGAHETASYDKFSFDYANRGCSVRIGRDTEADGKGYFEDRRPGSNMDPYLVTGLIFQTTCLPDDKTNPEE